MTQVAVGLSHATSRGVVHRDVKPSNIVITPDGKAKIVDMGLARHLDARAGHGQVTQSGVTLGTFDYISPEQAIEPRSADCRSDIYSLGCTFYHALTGRPPVPEGTAAKKLHCHQHVPPIDPRELNPAIPDELAAVLGKMMAKNPKDRYQHPDDLVRHLTALAAHDDATRSAFRPVVGAVPAAPRLAGWGTWAALAGLVAVVAVVAGNTRSRGPLDAAPPWHADRPAPRANPPAADPADPVLAPDVPAAEGIPTAATAAELVALIKRGVGRIHLTGDDYDLTARPPADLAVAADLVVERGPGRQVPPVLRLTAAPAEALAATKGALTLVGLRVEVAGEGVGIANDSPDDLTLDRCTIVGPAGADGPTLVAVTRGSARLKQCCVPAAAVAVRVAAGTTVAATNCVFAPARAAVQATGAGGLVKVRLEHCSALLGHGGSVVEVGDGAGCRVKSAGGLYSAPEMRDHAAFLRQLGTRSSATAYVMGTDAASKPMPNAWHQIAPYAEGDVLVSLEECKATGVPVAEGDRIVKKSPWEATRPLEAVRDRPAEAFKQDVYSALLRLPDEPDAAFGSRWAAEAALHVYPLTKLTKAAEERPANVKVWDPALADRADAPPPGEYATLEMALASVKPGDTLLVRANGKVPVKPCEFKDAETRLTIKPADGYKPVLVPALTSLKKEPCSLSSTAARWSSTGCTSGCSRTSRSAAWTGRWPWSGCRAAARSRSATPSSRSTTATTSRSSR